MNKFHVVGSKSSKRAVCVPWTIVLFESAPTFRGQSYRACEVFFWELQMWAELTHTFALGEYLYYADAAPAIASLAPERTVDADEPEGPDRFAPDARGHGSAWSAGCQTFASSSLL